MNRKTTFLLIFSLALISIKSIAQTDEPADFTGKDFPGIPIYAVKDSVAIIEPEAYYSKINSDVWGLVQNNDDATGDPDNNGCTEGQNVYKEVNGVKYHEQVLEYTGAGYVRAKVKGTFCNDNGYEGQYDPYGECVGKSSEWLIFKIYVSEGEESIYNINFRNIHSQQDGDNDVWLGRIGVNNAEKKADCNHDLYTYQDDWGIYSTTHLDPGIHTFYFAPRSQNFGIDRLVIYSAQNSKWRDALPLSTPVSSELKLAISSLNKDTYSTGESISIPFTTSHPLISGNTFTAQLSDKTGSFDSPTNIGSSTGVTSGTIDATIPSSISEGSGYRIRIVTDKPSLKSNDNGSDITIKEVTGLAQSKITNSEMHLYPNPANEYFVIENKYYKGQINITIRDLVGKKIHDWMSSIGKQNSITHLEKGVYFITVNYKNHSKYFRLVVE